MYLQDEYFEYYSTKAAHIQTANLKPNRMKNTLFHLQMVSSFLQANVLSLSLWSNQPIRPDYNRKNTL